MGSALRWRRTRGFSETAVINDLPRSLALDVRVELYNGLLDRVPLFKGVEDTFVRQLVKLVRSPPRPASPPTPPNHLAHPWPAHCPLPTATGPS